MQSIWPYFLRVVICAFCILAASCGGGETSSSSEASSESPPTPPPSVNSPPQYTGKSEFFVEENEEFSTDLSVTDADGDTISYELIRIGDYAYFDLSSSGTLSAINPFDYEDPKDFARESIYDVTFEASDGKETIRVKVQLTVQDVEEKNFTYELELACADHDIQRVYDRYRRSNENSAIYDLVRSYGRYRTAIQLHAVNETGQILEAFGGSFDTGEASVYVRYGDPSFNTDYTAFVDRNMGQFLQITCVYSKDGNRKQLKYRVKLDESDIWLGGDNNRTSTFHPVSALSDLYVKIQEANATYRVENDPLDQITGTILSKDAYYTAFNSKQLCSSFNCEYAFLSAQTGIQNHNMRSLFLLAREYTDSNLETLNDLIVEEYIRVILRGQACSVQFVCVAFFRQSGEQNVEDTFNNNLDGWQERQTVHNDASIVTKLSGFGENTKVRMDLNANSTNSGRSPAIKTIYQTMRYETDKYILPDLTELTGGNDSFGSVGTGSGMSGWYLCAKSSDEYIGCNYYVIYQDLITLPIAVGLRYQVNDTDIAVISPPFALARHLVDIDRSISEIPSVQDNMSSVTDIEYGLIVYEDKDSAGNCSKCFATVEANRLSILN